MKKFFKSPWAISIGTALFSFLLTIGYDLVKGKQIFATISVIFSALWNGIIAFLTFELKVWWLLLGVAIIIVILFVISKLYGNKSDDKPDFISYTSDFFRLWKWSWNWELDFYTHKWRVTNLRAHCPKCDTPMISDRYEDVFQCPRCRFHAAYDQHEKSFEVEAVIIDNLDRQIKKEGMQ